MIQKCRDDFFLPESITYLNCAYMSPMMRQVEEAGIEGIRRKRNPSLLVPSDFFDPVDEVRKLFARLIKTSDYHRVAVAPSVSYGVANISQNISLSKGDKVVVIEDQFPSNFYIWQNLCNTTGAKLVTVNAPDRTSEDEKGGWNEAILQSIDSDTRLVALPHVHWADGYIFDLAAIRRQTRECDALLVIDGTQSLGAFPYDQSEIQADAIIASVYKWLMGPYGIALCYYGEVFDDGRPIEHSWMNRVNSDDFARLVNYEEKFRPGAKRYEVGEASNFIHIPMVACALKIVLGWTPEAIQKYCFQISQKSIQRLKEFGCQIGDSNRRSHHLFGIRLPARTEIDRVKGRLIEAGVFVSIRGSSLRISPHVYNDEQDFDRLTRTLEQILQR